MSVLTKEDIERVVSRSLGPNMKILDYRLEPFTKSKNGIFGNHQLLSIDVKTTISTDIDMKTYTFFVKSPPESSVMRNDVMDQELFFEEIHFYEEVYTQMADNINGDKWSPQCYLVKGEVLVFEDLRSQGYCVREDIPLDEMKFLKPSLATLARFHAATIATEAKLGKTLHELFPTAFVEKMYSKTKKFGKCTAKGFDTIVQMAEKLGIDSSLVQRVYDRSYGSVRYREGKCNVVCHGDLWKNNILVNENASPCCILVDFQLLRYASPACDIGMLLFLHTTPAFRKKFEFELFDHYYSVLRDTLERSKSKPTVPNYEDLREDYRQLRMIGMAYASLYLPGIYLKSEDFDVLLNDANALENWFFHDRMNLIGSTIDADPVYRSKLKNIMEELFEEAGRVFG